MYLNVDRSPLHESSRTFARSLAVSVVLLAGLLATGCQPTAEAPTDTADATTGQSEIASLLDKYTTVRLTTDLPLSDSQEAMIPILIDAAFEMESVFWQQAYGDRDAALALAEGDPDLERFIKINYGPWDRLDGNRPFIPGVGDKPLGANSYPADATKEEIEQAVAAAREAGNDALADQITGLYWQVRRAEDGSITTVPYNEAFAEEFGRAAEKLREAAELADNAALKNYLSLRADALLSNEYFESDLAWMSMKDNTLDFRGRPYRDLRRPAVRLQGRRRSLRFDQRPGLERSTGPLR